MDLELAAGIIVAERFRLERELGKGGMGAVWSATHMITHKLVALKFMHAKSSEMTARFVREAQTASAVRHPNVVEIYDVLPLPDGTPLMVMEMLSGEALADKLTRETKLSPIETAQIMGPVISAVKAAHAAGIVHRDLKPENIFLARYTGSAAMNPKVLDFGIAKLVAHNAGARSESALTRTGSVLGTPYYMSPEQVFGEKDVDVRADVWALGVILYQCLTGLRPFEGDNFGQLLKSITMGHFEPIENISPWVPPQLTGVVARMLRDRASRLSDLAEVEHVLASLVTTPSGASLPMMTPPSGVFAAQSGARFPATQSSGGFPTAQSGGVLSNPSSNTLTPSPMVRSGTMHMVREPEPSPIQSSSIAPKMIGAVAGALVLAAAAVLMIHGRGASQPSASAPPSVTTAMQSTSVTLPSLAVTDTLDVSPGDAGVASPIASARLVAAHPSSTVAFMQDAAPSASHDHPNHDHNAGTGGLSTTVPF